MDSSPKLEWAGAQDILQRWKAGKRGRQHVALEPSAGPASMTTVPNQQEKQVRVVTGLGFAAPGWQLSSCGGFLRQIAGPVRVS